MAYTPTNWANGDVITSEKLNKIEQGLANGSGGIFLITADMASRTFSNVSATFEEAVEAYDNGMLLVLRVKSVIGDNLLASFDAMQIMTVISAGEILRFGFKIVLDDSMPVAHIVFDSNGLAIEGSTSSGDDQSGGDQSGDGQSEGGIK